MCWISDENRASRRSQSDIKADRQQLAARRVENTKAAIERLQGQLAREQQALSAANRD